MTDSFVAARRLARAMLQPAIRLAREAPVWGSLALAPSGKQPLIVFLPSRGRSQSSLLRIFNIATALRANGWRTLVLPWTLTLAQRHRFLRMTRPDALVMQGARHELNRPALYRDIAIVYDMDDADFHLQHLAQPVRSAMSEVSAVIAGSEYVADWCRNAGAPFVHVVWTGTPPSRNPAPPQSTRPPVVAWAQTRPMTYTREAELVRSVMNKLAACRPDVTLRLYDRQPDDDPGFAETFRGNGYEVQWRRTESYSNFLLSLNDVAVGLAPLSFDSPFSRGKSFGKVLAYLDRGVPVIASDAADHSRLFTPDSAVITNNSDLWVISLDELLGSSEKRESMARAAGQLFTQQLTTQAAATQVDSVLRRVLSTQTKRSA